MKDEDFSKYYPLIKDNLMTKKQEYKDLFTMLFFRFWRGFAYSFVPVMALFAYKGGIWGDLLLELQALAVAATVAGIAGGFMAIDKWIRSEKTEYTSGK